MSRVLDRQRRLRRFVIWRSGRRLPPFGLKRGGKRAESVQVSPTWPTVRLCSRLTARAVDEGRRGRSPRPFRSIQSPRVSSPEVRPRWPLVQVKEFGLNRSGRASNGHERHVHAQVMRRTRNTNADVVPLDVVRRCQRAGVCGFATLTLRILNSITCYGPRTVWCSRRLRPAPGRCGWKTGNPWTVAASEGRRSR
jgi:hypothetical protein